MPWLSTYVQTKLHGEGTTTLTCALYLFFFIQCAIKMRGFSQSQAHITTEKLWNAETPTKRYYHCLSRGRIGLTKLVSRTALIAWIQKFITDKPLGQCNCLQPCDPCLLRNESNIRHVGRTSNCIWETPFADKDVPHWQLKIKSFHIVELQTMNKEAIQQW